MKINDIKELGKFSLDKIRPVWWCYGDIEGIKRSFLGKTEDEIEVVAGDYLDEVYDAYKGEYAVAKKVLTPEEFDYIYEQLTVAPKPLVFVDKK